MNRQFALVNSFEKYGVKNHKFEIQEELNEGITQEVLDEREIYWMAYYTNLGKTLLNLKGGGSRGKHSKELKEKMRTSRCEAIGKPVIVLKRNGEFIIEKRSVKEAMEYIGIPVSKLWPVYNLLNKKKYNKNHVNKTYKDYIFIYKEEYDSSKNYDIGDRYKKVIKYNNDGNIIEVYSSVKSAAESEDISVDRLFYYLKRKEKIFYQGYFWEYQDNTIEKSEDHPLKGKKKSCEHIEKLKIFGKTRRIPMLQYDLKESFIKEWESAAIAAKDLKIQNANITACARGKHSHCGGFVWKYKNPEQQTTINKF